MTDLSLREKLRDYFSNRHVQRLAKAAPFGFDVGLVAGVLGTVVALPGFAASGFGIIAAGLAINRVSSYLDRLAAPDLDDEAREVLLDDGLTQGDIAVQHLAAATIVHAGPSIALALPDDQRDTLITAMQLGIEQMGGPVAQIGPQFIAALRNPATHWPTTQATLQQMITSVTMTMTASDGAIQRQNRMEVNPASGPISMTMTATGTSLQEGNIQRVSGLQSIESDEQQGLIPRPSTSEEARDNDKPYIHLDVTSLEQLRLIQRRNMAHLATQAAKHGVMNVPLAIKNGIDETLYAIAAINTELSRRGISGDDPDPTSSVAQVIHHYYAPTTNQQTMYATGGSTITGSVQHQPSTSASTHQEINANDHSTIRDAQQRSG